MPMEATAPEALRLFIAVRCPASAGLRRVLEQLATCGPGVKPVAADDLHLTLRFLGDTPAERVPTLSAAIDRAVAAAGVGPIAVRWARLGRFPTDPRKPARVVHVTPADPAPFDRLAARLSDALAALDPPVSAESRPFHAHLTLARLKPPRSAGRARRRDAATSTERAGRAGQIEALLREHESSDLGGCRIEAVHLIASKLTPSGPIYRILHEAPL